VSTNTTINIEPRIDRVTRSRAETQATYDTISGWYDLLEGVWERQAKDFGLRQLGIKPGELVLEIGVGTGHTVAALARSVNDTGQVYGLDLSPKMLQLTQARLNKKRVSARVNLTRGDAVRLPFRNAFFDAIFMSFVLELFDTPEIPQVLSECQRVLQSEGGRICLVSLSKAGQSTWMRRLYEWGHRKFPNFLDCRPIFVQSALENAGFETLEATRMSLWGLPVEIVTAKLGN
jgi:ubiquinone/menaquinone biosynthesis C-methylase UbiE